MFNPDYPSSTGTDFLQYTYQNQQQNNMYYYPGNGYNTNPYGYGYGNNPQSDSRRNVMNPVNPFNQFGQNQQNAIPESAVKPFSSYPPATPMGAPSQPMGLNSLVESRRNIPTNTTPNTSSNPWATQQQPQPNPFQAQQNTTNFGMNGCYDPYNPAYKIDPSMAVLYGNTNPTPFDKHCSWDNFYTQPRNIDMPNINWNAQYNNNQACYNNPLPQYPVQQYPTAQQNWKEIAEKNWGSSNL